MDRSERIGLSVSTAGHVLLIAALSLGLLHWGAPKVLAPPSIEVALTDEIALRSTVAQQQAATQAQAPELGATETDAVPPPPAAQPEPDKLTPAPPEPKATPKPEKAKDTVDTKRLNQAISALTPTAAEKAKPTRASRLGDDFLKGLNTPSKSATQGAGTAPLDAATKRALNAEISRRLKPYWNPPSGADADKLVTVLEVKLAPDGSLLGQPRVLSQSGVTASNASQKTLHAENAIRAVKLAAPFKLPPDLYDAWQSLHINFDYRLSQ